MTKKPRIVDGKIDAIILPTRERQKQRIEGDRDVVITESSRGGVEVRTFTFPLDYYLRKDLIGRKQWLAGNRLHELWTRGCLSGYVQYQYREGDGGARETEFTPPGAWAVEYREAMAAIRGLPQRRIAYHVCCEGQYLSTSLPNRSASTGRRVGMPRLIDALDDLAEYFAAVRRQEQRMAREDVERRGD